MKIAYDVFSLFIDVSKIPSVGIITMIRVQHNYFFIIEKSPSLSARPSSTDVACLSHFQSGIDESRGHCGGPPWHPGRLLCKDNLGLLCHTGLTLDVRICHRCFLRGKSPVACFLRFRPLEPRGFHAREARSVALDLLCCKACAVR